MNDGLKQRLVGAIVLLAIAVLFLPSLFSRDARRSVDLTTQIPPEPATITRSVDVAAPERPDNIPAAKPVEELYPHEPADAEIAETDSPAGSDPGAGAVAEARTQQAPDPAPEAETQPEAEAPALTPEGVPAAWSLQVASFSSSERAQAMRQRLEAAGYKAYSREAQSGQATLHRVFVGPKINKAAAEAEKRALDQQFNTESFLVEFQP